MGFLKEFLERRRERKERLEKMEEAWNKLLAEEKERDLKKKKILGPGIMIEENSKHGFGYMSISVVKKALEENGVEMRKVRNKDIRWATTYDKFLGGTPMFISRDPDDFFGSENVLVIERGIEKMAIDICSFYNVISGVRFFYDASNTNRKKIFIHIYGIWWPYQWTQLDPHIVEEIVAGVLQPYFRQ